MGRGTLVTSPWVLSLRYPFILCVFYAHTREFACLENPTALPEHKAVCVHQFQPFKKTLQCNHEAKNLQDSVLVPNDSGRNEL